MKSKLFIFAWTVAALAALLFVSTSAAVAQEGEPVVVDSVIAQVNGDVVMLSTLKREIKDAIDSVKKLDNLVLYNQCRGRAYQSSRKNED